MTDSEFDTDTAVHALDTCRYGATVTDRWSAITGTPNGGYLLGIATRALRDTLPDSHPDPLVVSAFFLRPGLVGPAEVHTGLARTGRRIATGEARLVQDGRETVRVVANFADLGTANGRTTILGEAPKLPDPETCTDISGNLSIPGLTIADRYRFRFTSLPGWLRGEPSGEPHLEFWMRFADGREPDTLCLPALADAAAPAVMELGEYRSSTVELTVHVRARPAPGWLACRVSTRYLVGGYHEEDFELWDTSGVLVAQARQLALLPG